MIDGKIEGREENFEISKFLIHHNFGYLDAVEHLKFGRFFRVEIRKVSLVPSF